MNLLVGDVCTSKDVAMVMVKEIDTEMCSL